MGRIKKEWIFLIILLFKLNIQAQSPRLVIPVGHSQGVRQIIQTPDGKFVMSRSFNDFNIRVWDTKTGRLVREIPMKDGSKILLASPDNQTIFIGGFSQTSCIYNFYNPEKSIYLNDTFSNAEYSFTGDTLFAYRFDSIFLINTQNGNVLRSYFYKQGIDHTESLDGGLRRLIVNKKGSQTNFEIYETDSQKLLYNLQLEGVVWYRFDTYKSVYRLFTLGEKDIHIRDISRDSFKINGSIYPKIAKAPSTVDFSPISGHYAVAYSASKKVQLIQTDRRYFFDNTDFSGDITCVAFVNKGRNVAITTNFCDEMDYYDDSLNFICRHFSQLVNNGKNVSGTVEYNPANNTFSAVLQDNCIYQFRGEDDTIVLLNSFKGETTPIVDLIVNKDYGLILDDVGAIKKFSANEGKILSVLPVEGYNMVALTYNPTTHQMATITPQKTLCIWDAKSMLLLDSSKRKWKTQYGIYNFESVNLDIAENHVLLVVTNRNVAAIQKGWATIEISDIKDLKPIASKKFKGDISDVRFINQGKNILITRQSDSVIYFTDLKFNIIKTLHINSWIMDTRESYDGKLLIVTTNAFVQIFNLADYSEVAKVSNHNYNDLQSELSPDNKILLVDSGHGDLSVWDIQAKRRLGTFSIHYGGIVSRFIDNQIFITTSEDGYLKYWKLNENGIEEIFSLVPFSNEDYMAMVKSGYYQCTPSAAKMLHYVTRGNNIITFEQLDVKYNRPDLVLNALGNPDTNLIHSYKLAYQKRIKKLGIDTLQFTPGFGVPEADIANRDSFGYTQTSSTIKLHIKGRDTANILDRFNIWVNEVPLYGQRGISLRQKNAHGLDTTLQVELMQGENKIEASVLNINGTESYRMPLQVKYQPDKKLTGKVHFIGLGIDRFANPQYNLNYSTKDIRDLAAALAKRYGDTLQTDTLFNADITLENLQKIKQKLLKGSIYDKVIVVFSGHGILSKEFDYYLSTYNVDFEHPETNGLAYESLESLLDGIPARQKLMLIDACHSGEVDKDELVRIKAEAKELGLKGVDVVAYEGAESGLGLQNSFELMQSLFVNVGKGTGATIISASAGTQFALENRNLKNGVFTYCILEALQTNPSMTVSKLKETVGKRVVEITHGMQQPTSRNETIYADWYIW